MPRFLTHRPLLSASVTVLAVAALVASLLMIGSSAAPAAVAVHARYSPIGTTANGPSGPATAKFTAGPYSAPSTAVVLTPTSVSTENDFQWAQLALPSDNTSVSEVQVCYSIITAVVGRTYISQTRITDMTTPNSALVRLDDGTDRTAAGPTCYTVPAAFTPTGSMSLGLKVVFGSTSDRILLGMVAVSGQSE